VGALAAQLAAGEAERKEALAALLATEQAKMAAVAELGEQVRRAARCALRCACAGLGEQVRSAARRSRSRSRSRGRSS
jgi:hypothetical protein